MRWKHLLVAVGLLTVLLAACDSETDDSDASPTSSSSSPASTTTVDTSGGARGSGSECPAAPDGMEPAPSAVAADLDGDGEADAAWIEADSGGTPRLVAMLASGADVAVTLEEDPVVEPEIVSVVDIGGDRDSLLVLVGTGAYTTLVGVFGLADCEMRPVVDPEFPESGPFTLADGASVMNGAYYACFTRDGQTALVTGSWTTNDAGEKEWSEGLVRREGLEIIQAGEAVTGVAETEEGVGTDRGEECPEPRPV